MHSRYLEFTYEAPEDCYLQLPILMTAAGLFQTLDQARLVKGPNNFLIMKIPSGKNRVELVYAQGLAAGDVGHSGCSGMYSYLFRCIGTAESLPR